MKLPEAIIIDGKECLDVLCCKILIWEANSDVIEINDPDENKCLVIRECESIEINDTYKKLINSASVRFPRGTVIKRTITSENIEKEGATTVYTERLIDGTVVEKRKGYSTAQPTDFKVGQRIRIYLGYYKDRGKVFKNATERLQAMEKEAFVKNVPDFDGYIVKCSVSTPIEIKCENLASGLKRKNVVKLGPMTVTVNDLLKEGGKYDLLKGTGLKLHPKTAERDINIGKIQLTEDLTVADVLTEWNKYGLYSFIRKDTDGTPYVMVGHTYLSGNVASSILNTDGSSDTPQIQFDYHVAQDNLTLMNCDPRYLAVSAEGFKFESNKQIKYNVTVRLNPEWTGQNDTEHKKFQILNETKLSKKSLKLGAIPKSKTKDRVNLSAYNVIPYVSSKIGISEDELIKEAEAFFEGYNRNGVEGSITIFGDLHRTNLGMRHLESGMKVVLLDKREPEKQGWYLIEEINTKFGVNGFRQTLKLPYCIAKPEKE